MVVNLSIPDDLFMSYGDMGYARPHTAIVAALKKFAHLNPQDERTLVVTGAVRDKLEKLTGSTIDSADDLLAVVERIATLHLDEMKVQLPEEVRKFYVGQAEFFGRKPEEFLREKLVELLRKGAWA